MSKALVSVALATIAATASPMGCADNASSASCAALCDGGDGASSLDAAADTYVKPVPLGPWAQLGSSLATDPNGWAFHPAVTTAPDGTIYAAWSQHLGPASDADVGTRVAKWNGTAWEPIGDRIGHPRFNGHAEGYAPSIVIRGTTPYVAWYEGGGYGYVGTIQASVFVAHWDGTNWVYDTNNASAYGALNDNANVNGRNPVLAVVGSDLLCAFVVENQPIVVQRLAAGAWVAVGSPVGTPNTRVLDLAMTDIGGAPHLAWTENDAASVHVARFDGTSWNNLGDAVNATASHDHYSVGVSITAVGTTPYVAMQERGVVGPNEIHVRHFDGTTWQADGDALNFQPTGDAGHPTIGAGSTGVWVGWAESAPQQVADIIVRTLDAGTWSAPESVGRIGAGSADGAAITVNAGVPTVVWSEREPVSSTKQVYAKSRGKAASSTPVTIARFGPDGPPISLVANTWTVMSPGGITQGVNLGDEAYSTLAYDHTTRRAYVLGKYHGGSTVTGGEDQNALLAYDFTHNRWDLSEAIEDAASEHLAGVGHDMGDVVVDSVHGLYISSGNLTLNSGAGWQTYTYDLVSGRGHRMIPLQEPGRGEAAASAFDRDDDILLRVTGYDPMAFTYAHTTNTWTAVPNSPTPREASAMVYDTKHHVFIMYGGSVDESSPSFKETWTFDPKTNVWTLLPNTGAVPPCAGFMAFDSKHNVALMVPFQYTQAWTFDFETKAWTLLSGATPAGVANYAFGKNLTYDDDDDVFLFHSGTWLSSLLAFRYSP